MKAEELNAQILKLIAKELKANPPEELTEEHITVFTLYELARIAAGLEDLKRTISLLDMAALLKD